MMKLNVPDMTCGHCASTVEKAVKTMDPGARVNVDLGSKTVTVDSAADETKIKEVIRSAGYENETIEP
ncbi:MAG: heavy-metal-associated domain-containing protein [Rhizobiales bacterium]|nr:heavy-metal-associated domain-containing protein [Hyphomicrobiales bacterium]